MLVVIPARSGSIGVKRKNVQVIDGEPLVARAVRQARQAALAQGISARIVVAANDDQIVQCARLAGAQVASRSMASETASSPVAMVVAEVADHLDWDGIVVTWQPSTIISDEDAEQFLYAAAHQTARRLVAVSPLRHLAWQNGVPLTTKRVNRQQLETVAHLEVGLFADVPGADDGTVTLTELLTAVDVDNHEDLALARLRQREGTPIVFQAGCSERGGTGNLLRALTVADEFHGRTVLFDPTHLDEWGRATVEQAGYDLGVIPGAAWIIDRPVAHPADLDVDGVRTIAEAFAMVVFEDEGAAAFSADLAVNELLLDGPGLVGPRYAVVRPEFRLAEAKVRVRPPRWNVLVTFGGSDPTDLTDRVARSLKYASNGLGPIDVTTLAPPLRHVERAGRFPVAEHMAAADLVVTSGGRTVHEAMAVGVPVVSLPVNHREAGRRAPQGVVRLPLAHTVSDEAIAETVARVLGDHELRIEMAAAGRAQVDGRGVERVAHAITAIIDDLA